MATRQGFASNQQINTMPKPKIILKQLIKVITLSNSYPASELTTKHGVWKWNKKGQVEYNQFKTLINYLMNGS